MEQGAQKDRPLSLAAAIASLNTAAQSDQISISPPTSEPRNLVLCFDGTGNDFKDDGSGTNILKIFRMLKKDDPNQYHYYQPGIGTYEVQDGRHSTKIMTAIKKRKDMAFGDSLKDHVLGGYKFLMRYLGTNDRIYIFGFSRGAYTAYMLAEMLDDVGLLPHGNEEMIDFAWDTFRKWKRRKEYDDPNRKYSISENLVLRHWRDERNKAAAIRLKEFRHSFRDTYSRGLTKVALLGLFDNVNSVTDFELPSMTRKIPFSSLSSATEIWHAVSINERRIKFRPTLIKADPAKVGLKEVETVPSPTSAEALDAAEHEHSSQVIHEVWFAGDHCDIGGGWPLKDGEQASLSAVPLMWMVRAARRAGVKFDEEKFPVSDTDNFLEDVAKAKVHDTLAFDGGASMWKVLFYKGIQALPLKIMDLQHVDGKSKWMPIRFRRYRIWETGHPDMRDVPEDAKIHGSVLKKMELESRYRPWNVILGDGREPSSKSKVDFNAANWVEWKSQGGVDYDRVYVRANEKS